MITQDRPVRKAVAVNAWFEIAGAAEPAVQSIVRSLSELNTVLRPRGDDDGRNGVIIFETITPDVTSRIHGASRAGQVLAVSTSRTPLGDHSWRLLRAGASDVVSWCDPATSAQHVADRLLRWQTIDQLVGSKQVRDFLIGDSPIWRSVLRDAVEVARFTNAAVLVTGESGTGKERVAQLVHELDPRPGKRKLVVLDCTTVVPQLAGSEFFGHDKGAFTGAATAREGAFELADGGTLFLDEVGELPLTLQAELLRVIQEGTFKRVGSNVWRKSRFRLVCATNRDLTAEQAQGKFRNDFYYRIAGCRVHLPSLRDRTEDIVPLFRHFFRQVHPDRDPPVLEDAVRELLVRRGYPGNVRELRSLVLRIAHRHLGDGFVTVGDVPDRERPDLAETLSDWRAHGLDDCVRRGLAQGATLDDIIAGAREAAVRLAVTRADGDREGAARSL